MTIGLAIYGLFLTVAIFGVSIAAARLAKDTTVDAETGNFHVKGSGTQLIRTSPVSYDLQDLKIAALKNEQLSALTDIVLNGGDVEIAVKGFARSLLNKTVVVFVEGGSVLCDETGLVSATGTADTALALAGAYAEDDDAAADSSEAGIRRLVALSNVVDGRGKEGSLSDEREPIVDESKPIIAEDIVPQPQPVPQRTPEPVPDPTPAPITPVVTTQVRVSCARDYPQRDHKYMTSLLGLIKGSDYLLLDDEEECTLEDTPVASGTFADNGSEWVTETDVLLTCNNSEDMDVLMDFIQVQFRRCKLQYPDN